MQANGLLEAKVEMMRDNLNAARVATSAKAALERQVQELEKELAVQSAARPASTSQEPQDQSASIVAREQQRKPEMELENELESLQQTNRLLTDQIRTLQVSHPWPETLGTSKECAKEIVQLRSMRLCGSFTPCLLKVMPLQAKADAARQETEVVTAENSQLGAHVQLLESELESARHGQATDSTEGSPRQSQLMVGAMPHGMTPGHLDMPEAAPQIPSAVSGMHVLMILAVTVLLSGYWRHVAASRDSPGIASF